MLLAGVFVLMILIPMVATERQSAKFVFTSFNTDNGLGIHSEPYIFLLGLLMSQYTITGYDASAHMVRMPSFFVPEILALIVFGGNECNALRVRERESTVQKA